MSILVVGSVALDSVKTPFGEREEVLGGSAVFFSVAASLFSEVRVVAVVGEDFPEEHLEFLQNRGVDIRGIQRKPGRTFRWKGYYDYDLNEAHTLETQLNVFESFEPDIPEAYRDSEYVFLANIDPELQLKVLEQVRKPRLVLCDTMNYWIENKRKELIETISKVDIMLMNDSETRELVQEANLILAARRILDLGPSRVIIKKGEHGVLMFSPDSYFSLPAYPLEFVFDPTGAGDSFGGGFLGSLSRYDTIGEEELRRSIVYGSVMASFNVEDFSCERLKNITFEDIDKRYYDFLSMTKFE